MEFLKKISKNINYLRDLTIIIIIIVIPFVFFTYSIIPYKNEIWYSELLSLDLEVLKDLDYLIWIFYIKILTLSVLSLWYITCLNGWRYVIFFPIIVEINKIFSIVVTIKYGYNFEIQYAESLMLSVPYILALFFISKKVGFLSKRRKSNIIINNEINKLSKFDAKKYKLVVKELIKLHAKKTNMDKKEYLTKLITLRDQLTISN